MFETDLMHQINVSGRSCLVARTFGTEISKSDDVKNVIPVLKQNSFPSAASTAIKRGSGGRSSFNGTVCTVFGANGLVGRSLINRLGKVGTQLILPHRGDPYYMRPLKVAGDLGQVVFLVSITPPYTTCYLSSVLALLPA